MSTVGPGAVQIISARPLLGNAFGCLLYNHSLVYTGFQGAAEEVYSGHLLTYCRYTKLECEFNLPKLDLACASYRNTYGFKIAIEGAADPQLRSLQSLEFI